MLISFSAGADSRRLRNITEIQESMKPLSFPSQLSPSPNWQEPVRKPFPLRVMSFLFVPDFLETGPRKIQFSRFGRATNVTKPPHPAGRTTLPPVIATIGAPFTDGTHGNVVGGLERNDAVLNAETCYTHTHCCIVDDVWPSVLMVMLSAGGSSDTILMVGLRTGWDNLLHPSKSCTQVFMRT